MTRELWSLRDLPPCTKSPQEEHAARILLQVTLWPAKHMQQHLGWKGQTCVEGGGVIDCVAEVEGAFADNPAEPRLLHAGFSGPPCTRACRGRCLGPRRYH